MTREDAVAQIVAKTPPPGLSEADVNGILDCSPDELALLVQSHKDSGAMPSASAWDVFLEIAGGCVAVANVVIPITGALAGVYGIAKL